MYVLESFKKREEMNCRPTQTSDERLLGIALCDDWTCPSDNCQALRAKGQDSLTRISVSIIISLERSRQYLYLIVY
jgi:hypothetical protein